MLAKVMDKSHKHPVALLFYFFGEQRDKQEKSTGCSREKINE